jgi:hypothetical protein
MQISYCGAAQHLFKCSNIKRPPVLYYFPPNLVRFPFRFDDVNLNIICSKIQRLLQLQKTSLPCHSPAQSKKPNARKREGSTTHTCKCRSRRSLLQNTSSAKTLTGLVLSWSTIIAEHMAEYAGSNSNDSPSTVNLLMSSRAKLKTKKNSETITVTTRATAPPTMLKTENAYYTKMRTGGIRL